MTKHFKQAGSRNQNPKSGLLPSLNRIDPDVRHIHLMGICGTGMASLAGLLKEKGYHITGSDQNVYPPMSDFLESLGISVLDGYTAENLNPLPDHVIVGNVITRDNPEAVELARRGLPYSSLPQALRHFAIGGSKSIVVAGTHGKTTTASLAAWVLEVAGLDPGFMIGGIPGNFSVNFKQGAGSYFVIEGDEYDSAFFDKGPKFLHYAPRVVLLTGIEFDHADIYRDLDHVISSFRALISTMPPNGLLIANTDDPLVAREMQAAPCPVVAYGLQKPAPWTISSLDTIGNMTHVEIMSPRNSSLGLATPLYGRHNMGNLLAVAALSDHLGIPGEILGKACHGFTGVRRRQEVRGEENRVLVIDDFAHHPTAVRETLRAVKEKFAGRRIVAVFEPRSNSSRRNIFQKTYAESFDHADLVFIAEPPMMEKIPPEERFSSESLVRDLRERGRKAFYGGDTPRLLGKIMGNIREMDVVLVMSNGAFDNIHERLLKRLKNP